MNENQPGELPADQPRSLLWHRIRFLALIAIFLSPFIAGWLALYVFDIRPASGNYGALVTPVKKLDWPPLTTLDGETQQRGFGRKWTLLLFSGNDCAELCRSNLFYMRQLRTLLGRDTLRLQNVLVSARPLSAEMIVYLQQFPNLKVVQDYREPALYRQFELDGQGAVGSEPRLYLVDPDQNLMMYYPAENDPDRMLDDIKKLMKLSQIG
jgi:cytochrome oxidase Cu insertion factor (SCO1/SenC/PrrC family)